VKIRTGRWLLGLLLMFPLFSVVFTNRADAQVVVRVGPDHYHHRHRYRRVYYSHHHRYYRYYYR